MHANSCPVKWMNQPMEEHRPKNLLDQIRTRSELAEGRAVKILLTHLLEVHTIGPQTHCKLGPAALPCPERIEYPVGNIGLVECLLSLPEQDACQSRTPAKAG